MVQFSSIKILRQTILPTILVLGINFLIEEGLCRPAYTTGSGSVTETEVTHFEFIQRLGNPCGINRQERISETDSSSNIPTAETFNRTLFYESMLITVDQGLLKLNSLLNSDPNLPNCNGLSLETLPPIPSFEYLSEGQLFKEIYKRQIFLTAHFHIMGLDRQLSVFGLNDVQDNDIDEHDSLPSWRVLRCGNESENFIPRLEDVTIQMEDILCTLVSSANLEQRASFREPFTRLVNTTFFRYHSSCTTLQTRDCVVFREAKSMLNTLSVKFNNLLNAFQNSQSQNNGHSHDSHFNNEVD